ncbi:GerAB/ArcD/ProY family transporter [Lysinibacillus sp. 54212]|uniref:GerAB/ArcD/ProY family transporter n=1 Tax=Lysinibacillus sp. 54212 TaxID=3119829 RepID=UPI002FC7EEC3
MTSFNSVDEHISEYELMLLVTTNTLGVLILSLPRLIANKTISSDGWIGIVIGGGLACLFSWMIAKLVCKFPRQSFFSFSAQLLSKPVAIILTFLFIIQYILTSSYHARVLSELSRQYLFDRTPIEVLCLAFLLVVVYAVSESRVGIFRVNVLFLPIIIGITVMVLIFSLGSAEAQNIFPVFQTDIQGYFHATSISFQAFIGLGIVLFYISLVEKPKNAPKITALGVFWAMLLYLVTYIVCIGVFGNITTSNIMYPTLEVAKSIQFPGGLFERFDSVLFSVWVMTVFITCLIAFDIAVMLFQLIFSKMKKINIVLLLSPIIYFLSMIPEDYIELMEITSFFNYFIPTYLFIVFVLLAVAYKKKGMKHIG